MPPTTYIYQGQRHWGWVPDRQYLSFYLLKISEVYVYSEVIPKHFCIIAFIYVLTTSITFNSNYTVRPNLTFFGLVTFNSRFLYVGFRALKTNPQTVCRHRPQFLRNSILKTATNFQNCTSFVSKQ